MRRKLDMPNFDTMVYDWPESLGQSAGGLGSATWPSADLLIGIPFTPWENLPVSYMTSYNGSVVSGTICMGVYSEDGTLLCTTGAVNQTGTNGIQSVAVLHSMVLAAGRRYYLAMSMNNTTGTNFKAAGGVQAMINVMGLKQMASAHPLPARATFADLASNYIPSVVASQRTLA